MGFQDDYVVRTISNLVRAIARLALKKDDCDFRLPANPAEDQPLEQLYRRLSGMIDQRQINEAENLLFEELDASNPEYLNMALSFYMDLNELKEDELLTSNYSREEIVEGINTVSRAFGISGFEHFVDTTLV